MGPDCTEHALMFAKRIDIMNKLQKIVNDK